ncbi:OB-fold domain-containing protein [Dietzia maris]|uniref:OB-fold domain-containing protein n=1 Tax=Dietzia maris TaxID=37915 RepID=UPI0037CC449B
MNNSILAYGTYVPVWRTATPGARTPSRICASFDEDAATMGVAAARNALSRSDLGNTAEAVVLATSSPPYLDKTNATIVHAALALERTIEAHDAIGTARSTMSALRAKGGPSTLLVAADVRLGKPGSTDERQGADSAAAVLLGPASENSPAIAEILAGASLTEEFLDRWRAPSSPSAESWEERFGFERYAALIREVTDRALAEAVLTEADHVVVTSGNSAVRKRAASIVKGRKSTSGSPIGHSGAADPLIALGSALDTAEPGETILVVSAVDGADAVLLRATEALPTHRPRPLTDQLTSEHVVPYTTYLSWRGLLEFEPPRRPEPDRPAGPPSARAMGWKYAFEGSRCRSCGFVHLPPIRVCRHCRTTDEMDPYPASLLAGTIATYTIDHLAYSPSPPVVDVVIDFDGGGRTTLEVADAVTDSLAVGAPVSLTFRRLFTAGDVHNYFWKAEQTDTAPSEEMR